MTLRPGPNFTDGGMVWVTSAGDPLLLRDMNDDHLQNAAGFASRRLERLQVDLQGRTFSHPCGLRPTAGCHDCDWLVARRRQLLRWTMGRSQLALEVGRRAAARIPEKPTPARRPDVRPLRSGSGSSRS